MCSDKPSSPACTDCETSEGISNIPQGYYQFHCHTWCILGHWLSLEADFLLRGSKICHKAGLRSSQAPQRPNSWESTLVYKTITSTFWYIYSKNAICRGRYVKSYMKITICLQISLFQIDDNEGGMQYNTGNALSEYKALIIIFGRQSVPMLPPSCLSQTRGRRFIITRCRVCNIISTSCLWTFHFFLDFVCVNKKGGGQQIVNTAVIFSVNVPITVCKMYFNSLHTWRDMLQSTKVIFVLRCFL